MAYIQNDVWVMMIKNCGPLMIQERGRKMAEQTKQVSAAAAAAVIIVSDSEKSKIKIVV